MSSPPPPPPPGPPPAADGPAATWVPPAGWFVQIIEAVRQPIGFFALLCLIMFLLTGIALVQEPGGETARFLLVVFTLIVLAFVGVLVFDPHRFYISARQELQPTATPPVESFLQTPDVGEWDRIYGAGNPPPDMDLWYRKIRPTLHQASFYTVPTYYLDADLNVLDFNVAFELVFRGVAEKLRGKHVTWFIDKLQNKADVFNHGVEFTNETKRTGRFPFVDLEPIVYTSAEFGRVSFTKVASQLHDPSGRLQGWAVALMVRSLGEWPAFEKALKDKLYRDKLWSVYAGPYDRVLATFPPYAQLIRDVLAVIPGPGLCVGDLGAGTGNVTAVLLADKHRVYAVETNIGMLDRFAMKMKGKSNVSLVKGSVESLDCFNPAIFDAVVMVNVLYAVDDPPRCLKEVHRLLKPGGVLGFSTTHRETRLDNLLAAIDARVRLAEPVAGGQLRADNDVLVRVNRDIETSIARRHTAKEYRSWVEQAGFEITKFVDSTYHDAVLLVHARKA